MIRAVCPDAVSDLKTGFVTGWNVSPNIAYTITVVPGTSSCAVWLFDAATGAYMAGGAALVGTDQPVTLLPATSPGIGMVDADLGYHLLVTTDGTEDAQTYGIGPFVDGSDQLSAIYAVDDLAVVQATAVIRKGTHYTDDASIMCPLGFDGLLGDIVSATVHGASIVGDIESTSFQAGPSSMADVITIRSMSAILPDAPVVIVPPAVADDTAETDAATATSGNVLTNDAAGLTIVAVSGISANVGVAVPGSNGGVFTVASDGSWTFDPDGDFATLSGSDTAETSVAYHASNGQAEAMATLTVTVSSGAIVAWTPAMISGAVWVDADTVTLNGSTIAAAVDKIGGTITASQPMAVAQPILVAAALNGEDVMQFDGADWLTFGTALGKPANWTVFVVGMFASMASKTNMCGSGDAAGASTTYWGDIGVGRTANDGKIEYSFGDGTAYSYGRSVSSIVTSGNWFITCRRYASGNDRPADRVNGSDSAVAKESGTATTTSGASYAYSLGRTGEYAGQYATAGSRLKGFLFIPRTISDADAEKIEGYYAHLCGLQTLLPFTHPYKSAPPTV